MTFMRCKTHGVRPARDEPCRLTRSLIFCVRVRLLRSEKFPV